ncbi:MAG TPA: MBL fold metallo-hydrolase [Candidatus Limnocylindrales bacterium]
MELRPGLRRLGDGLVNSYLVQEGEAVTIVDAGMAGQYGDLERELQAMGRTKADVRGIVLTHGDTDHVGYAERLRAELGIPVYVHAADADRARGLVKKPTSGWGPMKAGPFLGFMAYGLRKGGLRMKAITDLSTIDGEATLDLPGSPRVIPLAGHTPGSVAVHVPLVDALFLGDGFTTRSVLTGEVGPRLAPFTLDPAAALASLAALDGIKAAFVLPGHGAAWTGGVEAALREIRDAAAKQPLPPARTTA